MTQQEHDESRSANVQSLRYCGDPEIDHLIDEIKNPAQTEALYEMPARPAQPTA